MSSEGRVSTFCSFWDDKVFSLSCSLGDEVTGFQAVFESELAFSWSSTLEVDFDLFSFLSFFFFFFFFLLLCFLCFFAFFFEESFFTSSSELRSVVFKSLDPLSFSTSRGCGSTISIGLGSVSSACVTV